MGYGGAVGPELLAALRLLDPAAARIQTGRSGTQPGRGGAPAGEFEVVLLREPDRQLFETAVAAVQPGGWMCAQVKRSPLRRSGPRTLAGWKRTFRRHGFEDVRVHWHATSLDSPGRLHSAPHFIPKSPQDTRAIPISRTIGADRVVNEVLFCFTHDCEIDWMLPGVAPTGRYVEVPLVGIITFRGDKLMHEHIYWDQASVLVQIGLLDPRGLPVVGAQAARKVLHPELPSNTLIQDWKD